jgi:hypothetical protein
MVYNGSMRFRLLWTALLFTGCTDTRLLVTIDNNSVAPASLRIQQGSLNDSTPTLLAVASRSFPLEVRFYDLHSSPLVVLVEGLDGAGKVVSHGAAKASLDMGHETTAQLPLSDGAFLDSDGDGIPDSVDDCPAVAGPCTPDLGGTMPGGKSSCDGHSYLLCDGFDAPALDPAWMSRDVGSGAAELDSIHPTRGSGELHLHVDALPVSASPVSVAVRRIHNFSPTDTLYVRVFVFLDGTTANGGSTVLELNNNNNDDLAIYTSSGMWLTGQVSSTNQLSQTLVPAGRWTCLVWTVESGAAAGGPGQRLLLSVDGMQVTDVMVPTQGSGVPSEIQLALTADQMPGDLARDLWFDDLVISNTPVSCSD